MRALIYWTIPGKTVDATPSDLGQFSTGAFAGLCSVEPDDVLTARLSRGQYDAWVRMPKDVVTPETVRVLTFLPPVADGGASAVVVLSDGRVMEVGLFNLRMLSEGA